MENDGPKLIDVRVVVDLVHYRVKPRPTVPLVKEHLEEDGRVFVAV